MAVCKIILPLVTMTNNELIGLHWATRRKMKTAYMWELTAVGANDPKYKAEMGERRRITIFSYRKQLCDPDNFFGGLKILIDAMVEMDLLCDDSPKYMELIAFQDAKKPYRTEVLIESFGVERAKYLRR